jgi:hypothetical protein
MVPVSPWADMEVQKRGWIGGECWFSAHVPSPAGCGRGRCINRLGGRPCWLSPRAGICGNWCSALTAGAGMFSGPSFGGSQRLSACVMPRCRGRWRSPLLWRRAFRAPYWCSGPPPSCCTNGVAGASKRQFHELSQGGCSENPLPLGEGHGVGWRQMLIRRGCRAARHEGL